MPIAPDFIKLADSQYPISKQRKLLQTVQVGKSIKSTMETVVLPYLTIQKRKSILK